MLRHCNIVLFKSKVEPWWILETGDKYRWMWLDITICCKNSILILKQWRIDCAGGKSSAQLKLLPKHHSSWSTDAGKIPTWQYIRQRLCSSTGYCFCKFITYSGAEKKEFVDHELDEAWSYKDAEMLPNPCWLKLRVFVIRQRLQ